MAREESVPWRHSPGVIGKADNQANWPMNVKVKFFEFFRRNPVLEMDMAADPLYIEVAEIFGIHIKFQDVTGKSRAFIPRVPVPCNLLGIFPAQYRIENGLFRQPGRKRPEAGSGSQLKFLLPNRSIKGDGVHWKALDPSPATGPRRP